MVRNEEYFEFKKKWNKIKYYFVFLEKNYSMARQHFLYSKDGSGYASMLVELHLEKGYFREIDLFIAQAVLQ